MNIIEMEFQNCFILLYKRNIIVTVKRDKGLFPHEKFSTFLRIGKCVNTSKNELFLCYYIFVKKNKDSTKNFKMY
jgi:hypothetical protein